MAQRATIAAVATAPGIGAVGILRISGAEVPRLAQAMLGRLPQPRQACLSSFRDADGHVIDQGLALYFPAPQSFTGEHVLELQGHGGPIVLDRLLARALALGARAARPGEFTERAFLEGKLDLTQAEAIVDLITSGTERQAKLAARSLQGAFAREIDALLDALTRERAYLEATLDFPDEELDAELDSRTESALSQLLHQLDRLLQTARQGERLRDGFLIVLAGPPNVGKSSLLNALSRSDRAIVTPIPGTTRDLLHADIDLDGVPLRVIDTAGLRLSSDPVEQEGVRRAQEQIERADLVLWVIDDTDEATAEVQLATLPIGVPLLRVRNKIDLTGRSPGKHPNAADGSEVSCSVTTTAGLDVLRSELLRRLGISEQSDGVFSARRRHLDALERTQQFLAVAVQASASGVSAELVGEDLRLAQRSLGEITGMVSSDDLLGRIFSEFCIGK